jgi:hypothetical protein
MKTLEVIKITDVNCRFDDGHYVEKGIYYLWRVFMNSLFLVIQLFKLFLLELEMQAGAPFTP